MRDKFKVFYENNKVDFKKLDNSTLIVLDANVLLHFFRYSDTSRKKLIKAIKKVESNLFIPYQAALEYHFSRQSIERANKKNIQTLNTKIEQAQATFLTTVKDAMDSYGQSIRSTDEEDIRDGVLKELSDSFDKFIESFKKDALVKETGLITKNDALSYEIAGILNDKVGERLTKKEIEDLEKEGQKRYSKEIPPGFMDENKGEQTRKFGEYEYQQKFGDLILWKEVIKYCKEHDEIKRVFLISDDVKDDWIFKAKGETVGIRVELKQELFESSGTTIELLSTNNLLNEVLDSEVDIVKAPEDKFNYKNALIKNIDYRDTKVFEDYLIEKEYDAYQKYRYSNVNNFFFRKTISILGDLTYLDTSILSKNEKYQYVVNKLMSIFETEFKLFMEDVLSNSKYDSYNQELTSVQMKFHKYLEYKNSDDFQPEKIVTRIKRIVRYIDRSFNLNSHG
ncbi:PIN-like domain-containing protein [Enterococcus thailandicus]|uniref:PIN-like domain-containing protein n=1 Tax=Enterococcus thailandicus TaxID=417368 RepID=UPI0035DE49E6